MLRRLCTWLATSAVLALPATAAAAETDPPPEPEPAAPPPAAPAPKAPPPAAPEMRVQPIQPPAAYPTPYWGAPPTAPAPPPQADQPAEAPEPEPEPEPEGIVIPRWQVALGARTAFVTNPGFDPFAEDNRLIQFSIGGGRTLYSQGLLSLAATAFYDGGSRQASARGEPTQLDVHRLSLGPELRAHLLPMLYAFARPSPAVVRTIARMDETATNTALYSRSWTFGFDAVGGVAFRAVSFGRGDKAVRLWLVGEGGYGWASSSDLRLAPDDDDSTAPERVAPVDLGTLAVRGPLFRILVATTF